MVSVAVSNDSPVNEYELASPVTRAQRRGNWQHFRAFVWVTDQDELTNPVDTPRFYFLCRRNEYLARIQRHTVF